MQTKVVKGIIRCLSEGTSENATDGGSDRRFYKYSYIEMDDGEHITNVAGVGSGLDTKVREAIASGQEVELVFWSGPKGNALLGIKMPNGRTFACSPPKSGCLNYVMVALPLFFVLPIIAWAVDGDNYVRLILLVFPIGLCYPFFKLIKAGAMLRNVIKNNFPDATMLD